MEYEFKIDANTGEVIKLKEKPIHGKNNENSEKNQGKERLVIKENDTNDDEVKQKESAKENKDNGQYRQQNEKQKKKSSKEKDRKSTRLNSSHVAISYAVFCLKKKKNRK